MDAKLLTLQQRLSHDETSRVVTLNVGGVCYSTYRSTLRDSHLLCKVVESASDDDICFVDRDPSLFPICLNWMRGVTILPTDGTTLRVLGADADYYGLESLSRGVGKALSHTSHSWVTTDPMSSMSESLLKILLEFKSLHMTIERLSGSFPGRTRQEAKRRFATDPRKTGC